MAIRAKTRLDHFVVKTAPSVEPISTAEMKAHLRVGYSTDDTLIDDMVTAARIEAERIMGRAIITQTIVAHYSSYGKTVRLPRLPAQSVTSVKQVVLNTATTLVSNSDYYIHSAGAISDRSIEMASPANPITGTSPYDNTGDYHLDVEYVAGYGNAGSDVPADIIRALKNMVADMYEHRQDFIVGTIVAKVPASARKILQQYVNLIA